MNTTTLQSLDAGVRDVALAARNLAERLPAPLHALGELAYNYRWSWTPGGPRPIVGIAVRIVTVDGRPALDAVRRQPRQDAAGGLVDDAGAHGSR